MDLNSIKWRTILVLVIIFVATYTGWNWLWGVLYMIWVVPSLKDGEIHFVEEINRGKEPVLFWVLTLTLLVLSLLTLLEPLIGPIIGGN